MTGGGFACGHAGHCTQMVSNFVRRANAGFGPSGDGLSEAEGCRKLQFCNVASRGELAAQDLDDHLPLQDERQDSHRPATARTLPRLVLVDPRQETSAPGVATQSAT